MTKPKLLLLLLFLTLLKGIVFSATIPIWHAPDEQAHFAQVQNIAEFGTDSPQGRYSPDLSQEIFLSEQLLGTTRNEFGKNKFTHHPEYRIDYTNSVIGKYENLINYQPFLSRRQFIKSEATHYPPLFYFLTAGFYRLNYNQGLINRVMSARLASILMGVIMVYFSFKLAELIFADTFFSLTAAILVSFQPMFAFLTAGVNSDNLMNLLFTVFFYLCALVIKKQKLTLPLVILLIITLLALKFTKPHSFIALPIILSLPFFFPAKLFKFIKNNLRLTTAGLLIILIMIQLRPITFSLPELNPLALTHPNFPQYTLVEHTLWTTSHTVREVIPWYWGVFNWLGVTLPRNINRILNRLLILAVLGLGIWFVKIIRRRQFSSPQKLVLFLGSGSLIYFIVLGFWDWLFRRWNGFSFGMQGRYYFPVLAPHLILFLIGLISLIPDKFSRLKLWWIKLIGLGMIGLNFIGWHTLAKSYYQLIPLPTFIFQISQYKPTIFKFPWLVIWFTLYLGVLGWFIFNYLAYASRSRSRI